MQCDLTTALTTRFLGLGYELPEARQLADLLTVEIVVLWILMGYVISRPGSDNELPEYPGFPCGCVSRRERDRTAMGSRQHMLPASRDHPQRF
jgi:hypothetical protein